MKKASNLYKLALVNTSKDSQDIKLSLKENFETLSLLGFDKKWMNKIKNELKF